MNGQSIRRIHLYLFFLLAAFPLLKLNWISIIVILMLVSGAIVLITEKDFSFDYSFFLPVAGIVFPYIIFLLFSENIQQGMEIVKVKLVLLSLALLYGFKTLQISGKHLKTALYIFCYAAAGIMVLGNVWLLIKGYTLPAGEHADYTFLYRIAMEEYTGLHPTYYCAIVYFAAFILLYQLFNSDNNKQLLSLDITCIVLCITGGLAAASRATFIAFCLITFCMVILKVRTHPKRWWFVGGLFFAAGLFLLMPPVQERLKEINADNMHAPSGNNDNGTNVRSGIYGCNIDLLKQHWLFGLGTGNVQEKLDECLNQFNTNVYDRHAYNTHNEYLNSWLTAGLFGIIICMACLIYSLYYAKSRQNKLHIYFIVFILICFFTENYLERQAGVTFYAFLQTVFFMREKA